MILVTGATGLVGAHLLLKLLQNNSDLAIKATYRTETKKEYVNQWLKSKQPNLNLSKINWVKTSITDIPELEKAFINCTHVYHCAGLVSFNPNDLEKLNKTNIEGTANMVNLALHFKVTKFIHVSSIATLGDPNSSGVITEDSNWNPEKYNGDYAISKNGGETEVWRAINEGLNAVIVNPGVILGDGFWDAGSGEMFKQINKGFSFYTKGSTGFVAVSDVVDIMIKLMESTTTNQRFILVEKSYSYQQILNSIANGLNKPKPRYYVSPFITNIIWRINSLLNTLFKTKILLSKDTATSAHSLSNYSNDKIIKELNYTFKNTNSYIKQLAELYKKSTEN